MLEKLKEFYDKHKKLIIVLSVVLVVVGILLIIYFSRNMSEKMKVKFNLMRKEHAAPSLSDSVDPRFNLMKKEKFHPDCHPCGVTSTVYALGQQNYDWLSYRPDSIRDIEKKEHVSCGPYGCLISGSATTRLQQQSDSSLNPTDFLMRKEFMDTGNATTFRGPPGYDVVVRTRPNGMETLNNNSAWFTLQEKMEVPEEVQLAEREQRLHEAALGL